MFSIPRPFLARLKFHHDFTADGPIRHDHVVVNRPHYIATGQLQEFVFLGYKAKN